MQWEFLWTTSSDGTQVHICSMYFYFSTSCYKKKVLFLYINMYGPWFDILFNFFLSKFHLADNVLTHTIVYNIQEIDWIMNFLQGKHWERGVWCQLLRIEKSLLETKFFCSHTTCAPETQSNKSTKLVQWSWLRTFYAASEFWWNKMYGYG